MMQTILLHIQSRSFRLAIITVIVLDVVNFSIQLENENDAYITQLE